MPPLPEEPQAGQEAAAKDIPPPPLLQDAASHAAASKEEDMKVDLLAPSGIGAEHSH